MDSAHRHHLASDLGHVPGAENVDEAEDQGSLAGKATASVMALSRAFAQGIRTGLNLRQRRSSLPPSQEDGLARSRGSHCPHTAAVEMAGVGRPIRGRS